MAEPWTPSLFISYAHDDRGYVDELARLLRAEGLPVWYDDALRLGAHFVDEIRARIRAACAVLVVVSPAAEDSMWVTREILEAERRDRPLVPILYRGDGHFLLGPLNYIDVRDCPAPGPAELAELRDLCVSGTTAESPPAAPRREGPAPTLRLPWLEALIAERDLLQADLLTTAMILGAVDREGEGWLRPQDGGRLSLSLLASIESAWHEGSAGAYSFSRQREALLSLPSAQLRTSWQEFQSLARAAGWIRDTRSSVPRYEEFVERERYPTGFFPTLRNPQLEPYTSWHDRWRHTAVAVHRRFQRSGEVSA